jgi:membrane fusion protein, copper/silver efflux system
MTTKAKRLLIIGLPVLVLAGLAGYWLLKPAPARQTEAATTASAAPAKRKILYWRAPMDRTYISNKPGKSPMGMDLIPVYEDEGAPSDSSAISIDPVTMQDMGVRTGMVKRAPLERVVRTVATIDYNEKTLADVTTKFSGWIEKLYVNATGDLVMRGQPLFEIYSPELYSAEVEYLLALGSATNHDDSATQGLRASALTKLKFFDISDKQINELERTGKPLKTLEILAPQDGFVIAKNVVEGQMVMAGNVIYRLADEGLVWVQADIYEQDLPYIKLGQEADVTLSYLPDRKFRGRVTFIYPYLNETTRTIKVRMEFHNPGYFLKPGMFASVEIHSELAKSAVVVPDSAILRSGQRDTVFVALDGGRFEPRTVVLGPRAENDMYQVVSGLKAGERVVTSGQFLLDSESQTREAIAKMLEPAKPAKMAMSRSRTTNALEDTAATPADRPIVYVCPMPAHISIEYDHPGKCPICGMTLVPVLKSTLEKMHPGGKVLYYTCPMPQHSFIHESKPGNCPLCGMTLIPVTALPGEPAEDGGSVTRGAGAGESMQANALGPASKLKAPASKGLTLYVCPMPQHADEVFDHPGKCPQCGMDLVPTSAVAHGKIAEAAWHKQHSAAVKGQTASQSE